MFNIQMIVIEHFVAALKKAYAETYSLVDPQYGNILEWSGHLALENIANSDALYHNVDHTIMVSLVGQAILKGKHLQEGGITPKDWLHFMLALLCHDIGYVKGVCRADRVSSHLFASGVGDELIHLPTGGTDAALTPYHVNRSKLFIRERFGNQSLSPVDVDVVCDYIEMTRFPIPDEPFYEDTDGFCGLVRASDFIGQLGDPNYLRKIPALYYEFEEIGYNVEYGYQSSDDMRRNFTRFYWGVVRPRIQDALRFLRVTQEGKLWIANLHSHVFDVEHADDL